MTLSSLRMLALLTASFVLAACDDPAAAGAEERSYGSKSKGGECPPWECGYNSAEVNGRAIRELNLDGVANSDGVRIIGFAAPAGLLGNYELAVEGDELVARDGAKTLRGAALIGATIVVDTAGLLKLPTTITIAGYAEQQAWAEGAAEVPSYTLVYPDVGALLGVRDVCGGDPLTSSAVVLGGETYDLESKTVNPGQDRWLTIACAGSAAAKLRLMNYGPQSDFDGEGHAATPAQRQATLKMLTADYCGGGESYTANGTPLAWENAAGTVQTSTKLGALEAVWSASGALCLEATRLADAAVDCELPSCESLGQDPLAQGEWITHLPE